MQQTAFFRVYNASAGSGKTFTLVKEYLKVILQADDIFTFQKILAITFTNKAADEMKQRVLDSLKAFSEEKETDLFLKILEETTLSKSIIKERSKKILEAVFQNYSAFSITTIDSFTHKIIKSFAYDLGLPLNFEVEMDAVSLLNEAVDVLISKIGTDKNLTKLLIDFSLDKVDDDKSWDISRELNEFAKILLNEDDTKHFKKLADKKMEDFSALKAKLTKHKQVLKSQLQEIGKKGLTKIEDEGLEFADFFKSILPKFLLDLSKMQPNFIYSKRSETIDKAIENHQFYTKTAKQEKVTAIEAILPNLIALFNESKALYGQYILVKLALKNTIPLAVLNNINVELTTLKEDNNIRLNAEFNQLISEHIKNQPAPFIYERIGQKFMHYFIDEMQDTSVLQWQNLIPLIDNALAQENSNLLLVGDGKQAIYRWRGGKAEQFIGLASDEKEVANPFQVAKKTSNLATNFRSYSEIIHFNNQFFQHAANFLQNPSYKKLFLEGNNQQENSKKGGFVSLTFLEKQEDKEAEKQKIPKQVFETIKSLENQFSLNEICVLVRKKNDGVAVANYLAEQGISIVSSETLLLKNSPKVNFIINVLQSVLHPNNEETRFEYLYFLYNHLQIQEPKHSFFNQYAKKSNKHIFEALKNSGVLFNISTFYQLPFYEKIEEIIRGFNLITSSDAYVQFFLDVVLEQQKKGTSMQEFLDFWELQKDKLSIVTPKSANAVRVMTIHKSKGLEFPVVIFPYDLNIYYQKNPKIWLDELPKEYDGFSEFLLPLNKDFSSINERTLQMYNTQREALELDNFNLLYVALTRAVEQLYVITEKNILSKGDENTNFYSGIFINYLKENKYWQENQSVFTFGNKERVSKKEPESILAKTQEKFISTPWQSHNIVMLANASKLWDTQQGEAINFGNLIHEMLSEIHTANDVEKVILQYFRQGLINEKDKKNIESILLKIVNHTELKEYFSEEVTVFNEREIVAIDHQIIIPDRLVFNNQNQAVIIDYKTGKPLKAHQQQVINYQNVLYSMQIEVIKKILVYINQEILVEEVC